MAASSQGFETQFSKRKKQKKRRIFDLLCFFFYCLGTLQFPLLVKQFSSTGTTLAAPNDTLGAIVDTPWIVSDGTNINSLSAIDHGKPKTTNKQTTKQQNKTGCNVYLILKRILGMVSLHR